MRANIQQREHPRERCEIHPEIIPNIHKDPEYTEQSTRAMSSVRIITVDPHGQYFSVTIYKRNPIRTNVEFLHKNNASDVERAEHSAKGTSTRAL